MAILFRVLLISLVVYLVVKLVRDSMTPPKEEDKTVRSKDKSRKVSKDVGEYVEFEELEGKEKKAKSEGRTSESSGKEQRTGSKESSRVSDKNMGTRDFR